MKLTYTGKTREFPPRQQDKLNLRLGRVSKMLDWSGREREAHAVVRQERHLHRVEITVHAFDHALVGAGADRDAYAAVAEALDNLEKQVIRMRARWRTTKRHKEAPHRTPEQATATEEAAAAVEPVKAAAKAKPAAPRPPARVFRVNHRQSRKPMTVEEAMLEIGANEEYLVYRDAKTDRVSVLLRRGDGHFDLIEG